MQLARKLTRSEQQQQLRARQVAYLNKVEEETKFSLTQIARKGGMTPSTLTRFRNKGSGTLSALTLMEVSRASGVPLPTGLIEGAPEQLGAHEPEAAPYNPPRGDPMAAQVEAFRRGRNAVEAWLLTSRSMEYEGYRIGDVVLVDTDAVPRNGDIVCVQITDWQRASVEIVFRRFSSQGGINFLFGAGPDEAAREPRLVDGQMVVIKGVVRMSLRASREHAMAAE